MVNWQYYPKSDALPVHLKPLIGVFETHEINISSSANELSSNEVLAVLHDDFARLRYQVEASKRATDKISVPVLFGRNGKPEKTFDADAFDPTSGTVVEIEAGRAFVNYQFLKDLFEACMMHDVNYLVIAVRNLYQGNNDFNRVATFFDTMYASRRLQLPLTGVLLIGY